MHSILFPQIPITICDVCMINRGGSGGSRPCETRQASFSICKARLDVIIETKLADAGKDRESRKSGRRSSASSRQIIQNTQLNYDRRASFITLQEDPREVWDSERQQEESNGILPRAAATAGRRSGQGWLVRAQRVSVDWIFLHEVAEALALL